MKNSELPTLEVTLPFRVNWVPQTWMADRKGKKTRMSMELYEVVCELEEGDKRVGSIKRGLMSGKVTVELGGLELDLSPRDLSNLVQQALEQEGVMDRLRAEWLQCQATLDAEDEAKEAAKE